MHFKSFEDFYEKMEDFLRKDPFRVSRGLVAYILEQGGDEVQTWGQYNHDQGY
jgi:hypothetical protein